MNPFKVFDLPDDASLDEVKKAWRKKAAKHHPDRGGDAELFRLYKEAFDEILKLREDAYDSPPPSPPSPPPSDTNWSDSGTFARTSAKSNFDFNKPPDIKSDSVQKSGGYFSNHFNGLQPLWQSYWINGWILGLPFNIIFSGLLVPSTGSGDSLLDIFTPGWLVISIALIIIYKIWWLVGLYRSANVYSKNNPNRLWGLIAKIIVGIGWLITLALMTLLFMSINNFVFSPSIYTSDQHKIIERACSDIGAEPYFNNKSDFLRYGNNGSRISIQSFCGKQSYAVVKFIITYPQSETIDNKKFNHYEQVTVFECFGRKYKVLQGVWYNVSHDGNYSIIKHFYQNDKWVTPSNEFQISRLNSVCG